MKMPKILWLITGLVFLIIAAIFAQQLPPPDENIMKFVMVSIYMLASLFFALIAWIFDDLFDIKEEIRKLREDR